MNGSYAGAVLVLALLALLPGPDFAVVTRHALGGGGGAGVRAAAGVVVGLAIWGTLTVAGLATVLAASSEAYTVLRIGGAVFLVGMGVALLWRRRAPAAPAPRSGRPLRAGLLTNLLNPKIAVFYTASLPLLAPAGPRAMWLAFLVATHAVLCFAWLSAWALASSRAQRWRRFDLARTWLERLTGIALVGFGLRVAAER
ncbi:MAG TPA: LysE family translocator [Solirubrobacterales bacterium]|nr:LysE family translocator [Solirubrobacterales bacterium]